MVDKVQDDRADLLMSRWQLLVAEDQAYIRIAKDSLMAKRKAMGEKNNRQFPKSIAENVIVLSQVYLAALRKLLSNNEQIICFLKQNEPQHRHYLPYVIYARHWHAQIDQEEAFIAFLRGENTQNDLDKAELVAATLIDISRLVDDVLSSNVATA